PWSGDFESMARQYWNLWGDALRQGAGGAGGASPQAPDWRQAVDWWSQLVPGGNHQVNDVVERFNQQARHWYGQMQQVAAQFAGRDHSPADIRQAWQQALGMPGEQPSQHNPFADLFRAMQGSGQQNIDGWMEQARPYIDALQRESSRWLHTPTFGLQREQQERWQQLAQAQQDYQRQQSEYSALMMKAAQRAFVLFEQKLESHAEPGRQITTARGLFDVWIDAAEAAYAEVALSAEFRAVYGALANAQMRLRQRVQREVEQVCALFGVPTRTEVDSAHRKIVELERKLRRSAVAVATPAVRRPPGKAQTAPANAAPSRMQEPEPVLAAEDATAAPAVTNSTQKRKGTQPAKAVSATRNSRQAAVPASKATDKASKKPLKSAARKTAKKVPKKASTANPGPAKTTARKAAKPAAKPGRKPVAKVSARKARAAAAMAPPAAVVSIKDWVTRNAAAPPPTSKKSGNEKRKRSSRK
ncbi:MAG TPA: class III poly(R)-hydroxyalkanoic acid synthase subunit PhaE, partial [Pseudoxanthomonas sp.]|nr:class III poly(R)-hydroxyalkanoic acid synthase subunit PhaE [Pseudoxanthomonas sp.]